MDPNANRASDRNRFYQADHDMSYNMRQSTSHARNIEELQKQNKFMQPHQHQLHHPRTRGRSILLAPKWKNPIGSQIVPLDGQAIAPDNTEMSNGCLDLSDLNANQMEFTPFLTKQISKGSTKVIGYQASGTNDIMNERNENANQKKSSVCRSITQDMQDSIIGGIGNHSIVSTIDEDGFFFEKCWSDGDKNYNANELNVDASGIYTSLDRSLEEDQDNCDTSRKNCVLDGSQIEVNVFAGGGTFDTCTVMVCDHQKRNATTLKGYCKEIMIECDENTTVHNNLLVGSHNSDVTAGVDTPLESSEIKSYSETAMANTLLEGSKIKINSNSDTVRADTLLEGSKIESNYDDTDRADTVLEGSKMEMESNSDGTVRADTLFEGSKSEIDSNSDIAEVDTPLEGRKLEINSNSGTDMVDTLLDSSELEIESNSVDTIRVDALVETTRNEIHKINSDTANDDILLKGSNTEMESDSNDSGVDTVLVGSKTGVENNSGNIARVGCQYEDSQKGLRGNFDETSKVGDLIEDSQKELKGNSYKTARVDALMEDCQKELVDDSHGTSRFDDLMEDSEREVEGNTDGPSYGDIIIDNNRKEMSVDCNDPSPVPSSMGGSQKNLKVLFHKESSNTLIKEPVIRESLMENSISDDIEVEHETHNLVEETYIDGQRTEKVASSALDASSAHTKLNSHLHCLDKVFKVCDETAFFEIKDCKNRNLHHKTEGTSSTPSAHLRRHNTSKDISIPSECLGFCNKIYSNKSVLLLSLRPSGQIILKGMAYIKCLLGSVNILGYTIRQGQKLPLFAPFPECSLLVQGPDAVTMTSNPGREADEEYWIHFFPKQAEQEQLSEPDKESSDSCSVDENFRTNWMTTTGEKCIDAAKNQWRQLNLVVGERAVVLEVSQFPVSSLDRVLCVCSGVDQRSPSSFMAVALHAPSPPRPRSFLTPMGLRKKEPFNKPVYLPFSWKQVVLSACADHSQLSRSANKSGVRVMVIGGQGVGGSTFTRFLVNSLLSSSPLNSHSAARASELSRQHPSDDRSLDHTSAKKASVCVLDLDPRHSEQSLPGTVSCARYTAPVLGPAFVYGVAHALRRRTSILPEWRGSQYSNLNKLNFDENPLELPEIIKEFLIGREDLTEVTEEYLAATSVLVDAHRSQFEREPLVVNCFRADESIDYRIILEVMRIVNPSHVVHIEGKINQETKTSPFNCVRANEELGRRGRYQFDVTGKYTSDTESDRILPITEKLSFVYGRIPSVVKSMDAYKTTAGHRHDVAIAFFFSALWPHFSPTIESVTLQRSVISTCHNFALHVRHAGVHYSQLLNSINCAGLVSLCYIDPKHIRKLGGKNYSVVDIQPRGSCVRLDPTTNRASSDCKDRPLKRLKLSATILILPPFNGDRLFRVHGWAVVKGVDPVDKNIHLLIPGCSSVLTRVNCIVQSNVQLPEAFGDLLYRGYQSRPFETFTERGPRNTKVKQRTNKKH